MHTLDESEFATVPPAKRVYWFYSFVLELTNSIKKYYKIIWKKLIKKRIEKIYLMNKIIH